MILRRIIAHLRDQQGTAIAIDFVIVVLGVFIGIQVSNLNTARIDRALEADYIERIVSDLDVIASAADDRVLFEQAKSQQVVAAMALTSQPPSDDKQRRLGNLLTLLTIRLSPNFDSSTFSDLQSSGRLSLIRDARLRNELSAYFARLQYLRAAVRLNNDSYAETYVDFLRRESIGPGYADPASVKEVPLTKIEQDLSAIYLRRFGPVDASAYSSTLRLAPYDPFWERLRANLSWRGTGASANETLLQRIAEDAAAMKKAVERLRAAD
jgi:hypothetical protein